MNDKHKLWRERYRPITTNDYIFHDNKLKEKVEQWIAEKTIPDLLLSGVQGSGKTTLSKILITELEIDENDVLVINASDENSVDVMRDKIKSFISTMAMGTFKIVRLEEADYITAAGQGCLRYMMEEYNDVARFILTCNYENKIIPAIKSRCQHFRFTKPDKDSVTEYAAKILIAEKVKFNVALLDMYVAVGYPDVRKIVNLLQQNTINGQLIALTPTGESGDYKFKLLELVQSDNWVEARKLACSEVAKEEWEDVFKFLYENLDRAIKFTIKDKWEDGIVIIADHLYKHSLVADAEINGAAMFIRLDQL